MISKGILSFASKIAPLGLEVAGIVRRIGSNVRHVAVGDRVCAGAPEGCFSTNAILTAPLVIKMPDSLSFDEAATMPGCFTTAIQALIDVGQLEKGQVSNSSSYHLLFGLQPYDSLFSYLDDDHRHQMLYCLYLL